MRQPRLFFFLIALRFPEKSIVPGSQVSLPGMAGSLTAKKTYSSEWNRKPRMSRTTFFSPQPCRIVAHRGFSDRFPENTAAAFEAAIAANAEAIECDLQLTADGNLVVCHDAVLDRYGYPGVRISETSLSTLEALDAGSWFAAQFSDQRFLSLNTLLQEFGHRIPLLLEVKNSDHSERSKLDFLRVLIDAIVSAGLQERVAVLGFDSQMLQRLHNLAPWAFPVLNTLQPDQLTDEDLRRQPWLAAVDGDFRQMSRDVVQRLHDHELQAWCFTCTTETEIRRAQELEVDVVITNDPELASDILKSGRPCRHDS